MSQLKAVAGAVMVLNSEALFALWVGVWTIGRSSYFAPGSPIYQALDAPTIVADYAALVMLSAVVGSSLVYYWEGSVRTDALKALRFVSLLLVATLLPLALFDYSELFIHVSNWQAASGFAPWFTNADALGLSALLAVVSSVRLRRT